MPKRSMRKAIEDYEKKFIDGNNRNTGAFYYSDLMEMNQITDGDKYDTIVKSLEAGFMIGYRCAMRNQRKTLKEGL